MPRTVLHIVDAMADFLRERVSPRVTLKRSYDESGGALKVEWAHPAIHRAVLPLVGELPPGSAHWPAPGIIVAPIQTSWGATFTQSIHLLFCVWNPGERERIGAEGGAEAIRQTSTGWEDLLILQEATSKALLEAGTPIGMQLQPPILAGIYNRKQDTPDYYPYWWGWMDFTLARPGSAPCARTPGGFEM